MSAGRLRAVVVDDEDLARRALVGALAAAHPEVEIAGECANGFEAVKAIQELRPDLVFLDVQMPKLSGFEVLELLDPRPAIVFVTAYEEHALRAFEVHAVDYLLKPVAPERLAAAVARVHARGAAQAAASLPVEALAAAARPAGAHADRIVVRDGARVHVIPVEALDYAAAQDDYVALWSGGKSALKQQTLAALAAQLDPRRFVRIHRSYVVNLERVARLEPAGRDGHEAVLRDGTRLPVSRNGYARLRALLE